MPVGGGSIANAFRVATDDGTRFVKTTARANLAWFEAECDGLGALAQCDQWIVPTVYGCAAHDDLSLLLLEHIDMRRPTRADQAQLGRALGALHALPQTRFGWALDNFIGASVQPNGWSDDWADFFCDRRLLPQLELARAGGYAQQLQVGRLLERSRALLAAVDIRPSLLHGDLWSGNVGANVDGRPVVFDPAVHVGDAECDIAMSELFGGFGAAFYAAYRERHGGDPEHGAARRDLYRLYHVLNHLNLFGGGYLAQANALIARIAR